MQAWPPAPPAVAEAQVHAQASSCKAGTAVEKQQPPQPPQPPQQADEPLSAKDAAQATAERQLLSGGASAPPPPNALPQAVALPMTLPSPPVPAPQDKPEALQPVSAPQESPAGEAVTKAKHTEFYTVVQDRVARVPW